jgi:hypothetical protein
MHKAFWIAVEGDLDKAFEEFKSVWDDDLADNKRNLVVAKKILTDIKYRTESGFFELLEPPSEEMVKIEDRVSPYEIPFALDIGLDLPLVGRVDGLVKKRDSDELWALEFKTTSSSLNQNFFDNFLINPQVSGYATALRAMGIDVVGTIIFAAQVSKTKTTSQPMPCYVQDHHVEDFLTWAQIKGSEILACERRGEWPKDISACTPYAEFGSQGFKCDFVNLCQVPDWTMLKDLYAESDFEPFVIQKGDDALRKETDDD